MHDGQAAVEHRRCEAGDVGDDASAETDDHVVAVQTPLGPLSTKVTHRADRLGCLAVANGKDPLFEAGVEFNADVGLGNDCNLASRRW